MATSMPPGASAASELEGLAHSAALSPQASQLRPQLDRMNPGFLEHSPAAAQLAQPSLESVQPYTCSRSGRKPHARQLHWQRSGVSEPLWQPPDVERSAQSSASS